MMSFRILACVALAGLFIAAAGSGGHSSAAADPRDATTVKRLRQRLRRSQERHRSLEEAHGDRHDSAEH